ncbi:CDP-glycerol glycerophosphotransferase family protein [Colwellia sp. BRX8-7]|uniref:CDP-glycerol glycerophosphotransferase family protein n=1 Tax=Colwellia sp. BRX8-7 TaxID=2759833 RepID=UPI0015F5F67A|nr:CDP-glycerol glycerophosphotransferase family protein [Colwellia sp. BRX8-7]MBA6336422.1 CDP-glycerol glycerophosphotransferase family protein [Colwellia sp. BRX8-7]
MSKLKKLLTLLIKLFIFSCAQLVPKKKDLWVFGAWYGQRYSDNPKAFFEYINENQKHIKAVWITKDQAIVDQLRENGHIAYLDKGYSGLWMQLRAEFAFVCQSLHDDLYPACISKKTKVVNLWHGLPLKKIMYDVFGEQTVEKNIVGRLFDFLSPYERIRNDYLLATSTETQNTLSKAFRLPKDRVIITGFPRNDVFLKEKKKAIKSVYKCIYMPTFRGGIGTECDLFAQYGFDVEQIDGTLKENNIDLVLRMHPVNKPPEYLINAIKNSSHITIDSTADIFDSIADYDCMITDYSGGYFDFMLTGKPILFAPFDLEKYKQQERDLYYKYEDVTIGPYSYSWPELITRIIEVRSQQLSANYEVCYEQLTNLFHTPLEPEYRSFSEKLFYSLSH